MFGVMYLAVGASIVNVLLFQSLLLCALGVVVAALLPLPEWWFTFGFVVRVSWLSGRVIGTRAHLVRCTTELRELRKKVRRQAVLTFVVDEEWEAAIDHLARVSDEDTVDQLFYQIKSGTGMTSIMLACYLEAPLELVQLMARRAKADLRNMCLLTITDTRGFTALHYAVVNRTDSTVLEFLIREHPQLLRATPHPPLIVATILSDIQDRPVPILHLLTDATNALVERDFGALAASVHGDKCTLRCLVEPDYAARLATRVLLLLCFKHCAPNLPAAPVEPLDLRIAHDRLCDDVFMDILSFL